MPVKNLLTLRQAIQSSKVYAAMAVYAQGDLQGDDMNLLITYEQYTDTYHIYTRNGQPLRGMGEDLNVPYRGTDGLKQRLADHGFSTFRPASKDDIADAVSYFNQYGSLCYRNIIFCEKRI